MATFRVQKSRKQDINFNDNVKLPIKFDISMLNMCIGYIFKQNSVNITRKSLSIMHKLFDLIDENVYNSEPNMEARLDFIKNALEAKLLKGFENYDAIINYCRSDVYNEYNEEIINNIPYYTKINYEEIKYVNKSIEDRLRYFYLMIYKDRFYETIERLDSGDYRSFGEINSAMTELCADFTRHSRSVKSFDNKDVFSLSDEHFDDNVIDIVNSLKNPKKMLRTGIQKLNEILSPAFMGGRTYVFMATAGGGKSALLLKIFRDIKKYNKGIVGDKPGKRPCVLLITMENEIEETVERLFNMTSSFNNIRDYTPKQVLKLLKESGEFRLTDEDNINFIIRYEHNRAISTDDLYTIIDDLSDSGDEVIALVLDYIKRIRPAERAKDEKEELKNVSNELKSLASDYGIPVITAHQLNRSGAAVIDAAMQANKADLARFLSVANVGSAWEVIENSDFVCIINKERKRSTGQLYLTFKRVKIRYKATSDLSYFNHPYENNNAMRLMDDLGMDHSLSEISLGSDFDVVEMNKQGKRHAKEREDISEEKETIFDFAGALNKKK